MANNKWLCQECIGNLHAKKSARSNFDGVCSYCGKHTKVVPFSAFFSDVLRHCHRTYRFDQHISHGGEPLEYWRHAAKTLPEIISLEVEPRTEEFSLDLKAALEANLTERGFISPSGAMFRKWNPAGGQFDQVWGELRASLDVTRHFNPRVTEILDTTFDDVSELRTSADLPIIIDVSPSDSLARLYRARVFQDQLEMLGALKNRKVELGPPPKKVATPGRMNSRGVSVFYGATREDVAIAEVRPPVGSFVAIGQFALSKVVRLLDLTRFKGVVINEPQAFDYPGWVHTDRLQFIQKLEDLLIKPVMPTDDQGYLITQVISDYLASHRRLRLDGIVFPSVQIGWDAEDPPLNVVLFNKASGVHEAGEPTFRDTLILEDSWVKKIRAAEYTGELFDLKPA